MYYKIFLNILMIIMLALFQLGFISGLPGYLGNLNLVLIVLVFLLVLDDYKTALFYGIGCGLVFDIYSFSFFGINSIGFILSVLALNFLSKSFFTNQSLYSFAALVASGSLLIRLYYNLIFLSRSFMGNSSFLSVLSLDFWQRELFYILLNLSATILIYYFFNFLSKRLKPVFIIKNKVR